MASNLEAVTNLSRWATELAKLVGRAEELADGGLALDEFLALVADMQSYGMDVLHEPTKARSWKKMALAMKKVEARIDALCEDRPMPSDPVEDEWLDKVLSD